MVRLSRLYGALLAWGLLPATQITAIYQDTRPPIGGRDSVMDVVFGQHITNQSLAEEYAQIL